MKFRQPTDQQLEGFVKGDPDSIDAVIRLLLPQLQGWASKTYFNLPEDDVKSVVNRVLAETCLRSSFYNPQKSQLTRYLINLIRKRIIDLYRSRKKYTEREESFAVLPPEMRRGLPHDAEIIARIVRARFFESVKKNLNALDRIVFELMRQGEDSDEMLSLVLQRHQCLTEAKFCIKNARGNLIRKVRVIVSSKRYNKRDFVDAPV